MKGGNKSKTPFLWPFENSAVPEAAARTSTFISFPGQIWIQPSVDACLHSQTFFCLFLRLVFDFTAEKKKDEKRLSFFVYVSKM